MNLSGISEPVSGDNPCGVNIREDAKLREIYYKIKDARNLARGIERAAVPGEPMSLATEWHDVNNFGVQILMEASKDVEVLAWVLEAQTRINGFSGFRDVFRSATPLFEEYWDQLYSIGSEDEEEKVAPLAGLNGVSGEGTLIQAIRLVSLVPEAGYARHTLWDYQLAQRPDESERRETLYDAAGDAGLSAMTAHVATVTEAIEAFDTFTEVLGRLCAGKAPPSSNTRNVLLEAAAAMRVISGISQDEGPAPAPLATAVEPVASDAAQPAPVMQQTQPGVRQISSREEAFEVLLSVARYFRRTEPHSPISLSIETLVRRGRMDFAELLQELLPEPQARKAVLSAAGIQPKTDQNND